MAHSIECKLFAIFLPHIREHFADDFYLHVIKLMAFLKLHGERAKKNYQLDNGGSQR